MKNLVTKIALPGAILAFAMALFGGTAYAFMSWQGIGDQHLDKTRAHIKTLENHIYTLVDKKSELKATSEKQIKELSDEKSTLEGNLKDLQAQKDEINNQLTTLQAQSLSNDADNKKSIEALQAQIEKKNIEVKGYKDRITDAINWKKQRLDEQDKEIADLKDKLSKKETELKTEKDRNSELERAIEDANQLRQDAEKTVERVEKAINAE
ncbi:hypothetical protein [Leuconostoc lactis]|uniref:hypothetical protein n=1 Tax=Leuconostoc lactis TaxID=1246 RepID=UPI00241F5E90|nr:hypothetical protein [Leuconostoc lactis]